MNNLHINIPEFVSVSDLQRDYAGLLKNLTLSKKPLLVLKKNKLEAVILLPDLYQSFVEKSRLFEEQQALAAVKSYKDEKKNKKLKRMKKIKELFES